MEKQGMLWVVLSVTILFIIILIGGMWLLGENPEQSKDINIARYDSKLTEDEAESLAHELTKGDEEPPGLMGQEEEVQKDDFVVGQYEEKKLLTTEPETSTQKTTYTRKTTPEPVTRKKTQPKPVPTTYKTETVKKTTPQPKIITIKEYWIQAGSYKSKYKAEVLQNKLNDNGITSRIISSTINNQLYFRVRIGPYTKKNEAEKFLGWIQGIQGMENSYISVVYAKRQT
jgi:DedD protein